MWQQLLFILQLWFLLILMYILDIICMITLSGSTGNMNILAVKGIKLYVFFNQKLRKAMVLHERQTNKLKPWDKYLGLLSVTGVGMNQSGGLYWVTLGVTVSSCHKSPVHHQCSKEHKSVQAKWLWQWYKESYRWMLYPCGLLVLQVWYIQNHSPLQCPFAAGSFLQGEW